MRLAGKTATFFLSEEGKVFFDGVAGSVLSDDGKEFLARVTHSEPPDVVTVDVEETDDAGIWVRIRRNSLPRVLLLRWEFILGIELPVDSGKVIGLRG